MRTLLLAAVVALSTAGCGIIYKQPIYQGNLIKKSAVEQLQVGQSKQAVQALLGTPRFRIRSTPNAGTTPPPSASTAWPTSRRRTSPCSSRTTQVVRWEGGHLADQDQSPGQGCAEAVRPQPGQGPRRASAAVNARRAAVSPGAAGLSLGSASNGLSSSTRSPSCSTCCGRATTPCTATASTCSLPGSAAAATASATVAPSARTKSFDIVMVWPGQQHLHVHG